MATGDPWQACSIDEVAALLAGLPARWWIAGGWAIDLFVGAATRGHGDVDVAVLRPDQLTVQAHLDGWDLRVAPRRSPHPLARWATARSRGARDLGATGPAWPWRLELLLDEVAEDEWVYRRNRAVRLPLERLGLRTAAGVPYLRPEVVLLYKAKRPRAADEHDARVAIPRLSGSARAWLAAAIAGDTPDHHWLPLLA